jgi:hypothetical protein
MPHATVDSDSLHRMRRGLTRAAAAQRLISRDHFQNIFGFPMEGEAGVRTPAAERVRQAWLRSAAGRLALPLHEALACRHPAAHLARWLAGELQQTALQTQFSEALARRLPAGGPPQQHLEDALLLGMHGIALRPPMSEGATAALCLAEALYDATFCAAFAYYEEITRSENLAMAYGQGYAETVSGIALGRRMDGQETYRPILGGGGYYEYLEARQSQLVHGDATPRMRIHFAPLRLHGSNEAVNRLEDS